MKLRNVYLSLRDSLDDFEIKFNYNVEFINWYLSKSIRKYQIESHINYNTLSVRPTNKEEHCMIIPENCLSVKFKLTEEERQQYMQMINPYDRYEYYLALLERGYHIANVHFDVPMELLLKLHEQFRNNNYKTEWVFKKMHITEYGRDIIFRGKFTSFDFKLDLEIYSHRSIDLLNSATIWRTPPHYMCFYKDINKISEVGAKIVVFNFLGKPHLEIETSSLIMGHPIVKYLYGMEIEEPEIIEKLRW